MVRLVTSSSELLVAEFLSQKVKHTTKVVLVDLLPVRFGNEPEIVSVADSPTLLSCSLTSILTYMITSSWRTSGNRFDRCWMNSFVPKRLGGSSCGN